MLPIKVFHVILVWFVFIENRKRSSAHKKHKNGQLSDAMSDKDMDDIAKLRVP